VFGSVEEAASRHRHGVRRLLVLDLPFAADPTETLDTTQRLGLAGSPYASVADLLDDVRAAILTDVVDAHPPARTAEAYAALVAAGRQALDARADPVVLDVLRVLADWRETDRMLSGRAELATLPALQDMREQLARLMGRGFLGEAGADRLRRFPTYLLAIRRRREQLDDHVAPDRRLMDLVRPVEEAYLHQVAALQEGRPPGEALRRVRWMLEEYRVSLFAQQLGADGPVSDQRIRKLLAT
jgi:ATP-dependent helicase HrpA